MSSRGSAWGGVGGALPAGSKAGPASGEGARIMLGWAGLGWTGMTDGEVLSSKPPREGRSKNDGPWRGWHVSVPHLAADLRLQEQFVRAPQPYPPKVLRRRLAS